MRDKIENWRTIKTDDPYVINFSLGDLANEIDNVRYLFDNLYKSNFEKRYI